YARFDQTPLGQTLLELPQALLDELQVRRPVLEVGGQGADPGHALLGGRQRHRESLGGLVELLGRGRSLLTQSRRPLQVLGGILESMLTLFQLVPERSRLLGDTLDGLTTR